MADQPNFALQAHVDYLYQNQPRRLAFEARTLDEFRAWQSALRGEIVRLLGLTGRIVPQNPAAERLQSIDRSRYVEEKLVVIDEFAGISGLYRSTG
jgi:hypothetical protein